MAKPSSILSGAVFDLAAVDRELRSQEAYKLDGHTARTLVRESAIRVVLVVIKGGAKIAEHHTDGTAAIHVVGGHVRLRLPDHAVELPAGHVLVIAPHVRHDVEAVGDSAFLITLGRSEHG